MPIFVDRDAGRYRVRLEGGLGINDAIELKAALLDGLSSGHKLSVDLMAAAKIDVTIMQLLHAAVQSAGRSGVEMVLRASDAVRSGAERAGFDLFSAAGNWSD